MKEGDKLKRKNLKKLLIDHDLEQGYVADWLEITENHFSLIINGNANPSFGLMEKFEMFCLEHDIIIDDLWELFRKSE